MDTLVLNLNLIILLNYFYCSYICTLTWVRKLSTSSISAQIQAQSSSPYVLHLLSLLLSRPLRLSNPQEVSFCSEQGTLCGAVRSHVAMDTRGGKNAENMCASLFFMRIARVIYRRVIGLDVVPDRHRSRTEDAPTKREKMGNLGSFFLCICAAVVGTSIPLL